VSGSGISWAICTSAPHSRQTTMPAPHHSVFYRLDALPAARVKALKAVYRLHVGMCICTVLYKIQFVAHCRENKNAELTELCSPCCTWTPSSLSESFFSDGVPPRNSCRNGLNFDVSRILLRGWARNKTCGKRWNYSSAKTGKFFLQNCLTQIWISWVVHARTVAVCHTLTEVW